MACYIIILYYNAYHNYYMYIFLYITYSVLTIHHIIVDNLYYIYILHYIMNL